MRRAYERNEKNNKRGRPNFFGRLLWIAMGILALFFGIVLAIYYGFDIYKFSAKPVYRVSALATRFPTQTPAKTPLPQISLRKSNEQNQSDAPYILIYHTHTREAYTQTAENLYEQSSSWRTLDQTKSVVAVGSALAERLQACYGFTVLHDTTDHEPPALSSAYTRSEQTVAAYLEEYPSIQLVIDLHRDSYTVTDEPTTDYATVNGQESARLMFVVGMGENYTQKPNFDRNLAFAETIYAHLIAVSPKLARANRVKSGRYNQHLAPLSLLVEMGHNANTLEQALASVPYLAEGIARALYAEMNAADSEHLPLSLIPQD